MNLITSSFPVCPCPILVVYDLLLGENNLTANFSPPVCSPRGEAGKIVQTGFSR
jgi:hypothetical protein